MIDQIPLMKKLFQLITVLLITVCVQAQDNYWQQHVRYNIDVSLNDKDHTLKGDLKLVYTNHSPDTLSFIWFHLWPNAYSSINTALARQLKDKKDAQQILAGKNNGYIRELSFSVNGTKSVLEPDAENPDVAKVILPKPLYPGDSVNIQTPFLVKLPSYFSRSGYYEDQYMVCQWYPKPAVYDKDGWHQFPYLDQGEFYSEYGSFRVNITLPSRYVVGATGTLQTTDELNRYKEIGIQNRLDTLRPVAYKPSSQPVKTLTYVADSVHDFAWFADRNFIIQYDTLSVIPGKTIDVFAYYQPDGNKRWRNSTSFLRDAIKHYSMWVGAYPYPTVAAVEGPKNQSSGGMEYPMITLITSPDASAEALDAVITHEVGHNWFYGIIGSNERKHPWMDEGLDTYFEFVYEAMKYRSNSIFGDAIPKELKSLPAKQFLENIFYAINTLPMDKPVMTSSTGFENEEEYGMVAYLKTATWMFLLQEALGEELFLKAVNNYFNEWKFKHPTPADLQRSFEQTAGRPLNDIFDLLNKPGNFK